MKADRSLHDKSLQHSFVLGAVYTLSVVEILRQTLKYSLPRLYPSKHKAGSVEFRILVVLGFAVMFVGAYILPFDEGSEICGTIPEGAAPENEQFYAVQAVEILKSIYTILLLTVLIVIAYSFGFVFYGEDPTLEIFCLSIKDMIGTCFGDYERERNEAMLQKEK